MNGTRMDPNLHGCLRGHCILAERESLLNTAVDNLLACRTLLRVNRSDLAVDLKQTQDLVRERCQAALDALQAFAAPF